MLKATQANLGRRMAVVYLEKKRLEAGEPCKGIRSGTECTEEEAISVATIQGVFSSRFQIDAAIDISPRVNTVSISSVFYFK